ncbi:hypothetical protein MKZ38_001602 [Zalerion maritima]|uniref:cellulose 1,4-beta-cellobiosidase (non-reducing end) n=1 Tax=Zalerion maritima TaxID=339359 RepID=A0AAD5WT31_9PEZI|nr:hypothetical protein MKZ38_001602 [Zalerion maritima]
MYKSLVTISALLAAASSQQVGTNTAETHPKISWQKCSAKNSCRQRLLQQHRLAEKCAEKCALDGADYTATYSATTSGDGLALTFITEGEYSANIGSRLYLMSGEDKNEMFILMGNEFTFGVDDGGMSKYEGTNAGAKYGTGYCDAQCPRDLKFIDGEANIDGWTSSTNDANAGHKCEGDDCGGIYSDTRYAGTCNPEFCAAQKVASGDDDIFAERGGWDQFSAAVEQPMVLVMSLWDDLHHHRESSPVGAMDGKEDETLQYLEELDGDVVLGPLMKAAIKVGNNPAAGLDNDQEVALPAEQFLRASVNIMMGLGGEKGTTFVQGILEYILMRATGGTADDETSTAEPVRSPSPSSITVSAGGSIIDVSFEEILTCFWSSWLDTDCDTWIFTLEFSTAISLALEKGRPYLSQDPTSGAIRFVELTRTRPMAMKQLLMLISTLEALFEGAGDAYGSEVECWHDYFSVPQWQADTKDTVLLSRPPFIT